MPAFTDWVGMVEGNASMYLASPRVAEKVTGERTTLEEMGGALMHASVSGCADEVFGSDWEVIAAARLLLSYLPDSWERRPPAAAPAAPARADWSGVIPAAERPAMTSVRSSTGWSTRARSSRSRRAGRRRW